MKRLFLLLVLFGIGCTSAKAPTPVPPVSIPFDASKPRITLALENVSFLADLDDAAESKICRSIISGKSSMDLNDVHSLNNCRGEMQCLPVPADGYMPARNVIFYTGSKSVPGFRAADLKALFTSALGGIGNITVQESLANSSVSNAYRVVVLLTEFNVSSDKNSRGFGGMGVGPMSVLQVVSVKKSQATGFVRFDIRILEAKSGRIVKAFSVAGSATDAYVSETFFSGSISEDERFIPMMMQQATRAALNVGAERVYRELSAL